MVNYSLLFRQWNQRRCVNNRRSSRGRAWRAAHGNNVTPAAKSNATTSNAALHAILTIQELAADALSVQ